MAKTAKPAETAETETAKTAKPAAKPTRTPVDPSRPAGYKNPPKETQFGGKDGNPIFSQRHAALMARQKDKIDEVNAALFAGATRAELNKIANDDAAPQAIRIFAGSLSEGLLDIYFWQYENMFGKSRQKIEQTLIAPPRPFDKLPAKGAKK